MRCDLFSKWKPKPEKAAKVRDMHPLLLRWFGLLRTRKWIAHIREFPWTPLAINHQLYWSFCFSKTSLNKWQWQAGIWFVCGFVFFVFFLRQKANQQKNSSWLILFMFEPRWSSSLPRSPGASKTRLTSEVSWWNPWAWWLFHSVCFLDDFVSWS